MSRHHAFGAIMLAASLVALAGGVLAAEIPDTARGRALYENHCVVCHTQKVHRRTPPMPIDLEDLKRIVSSWAKEQNLRWNSEDIEDVVHYLNRAHYGIEK